MNVHSRSTSRESEPNYRCFAAHDLLPIKASREWERSTPWTLISRTILRTIHRHNVALNSPQAGRFYPAYCWYPPTYGFAAWYNPYTGTFGRGAAVYGPYSGAGGWAAYNSRTGTYARGGALYGPYGSRGFAQAWNPRTGTYEQTRQGSNVCGNWGPVMFSDEITGHRRGGGFRRRKPEKCEEQGAERTGKEGRFTPAD